MHIQTVNTKALQKLTRISGNVKYKGRIASQNSTKLSTVGIYETCKGKIRKIK